MLANGGPRADPQYLSALNTILKKMYDELGSKNKVKKEMKIYGVCLTTGRKHGSGLRKFLKRNKEYVMPLDVAKDEQWPYVKCCLVRFF